MDISVCYIVKNEELVLERSLECAKKFAKEIIVVDTGSTDKTVAIAQKYADVYHFAWVDDFSLARNFSFSKATSEFVMWLDADDVILDEDIEKIKKLEPNFDALMCKYVVSFDKNLNPTNEFFRERILRNNSGFVWSDPIHESIALHGKVVYSDIRIYHMKERENPKKRNLKIYQKMLRSGVVFTPRQQFYYSRELMQNGLLKSAVRGFKKFLKMDGWIENIIEAHLNLAWCYRGLGEGEKALVSLLKSFTYAAPRPEIMYEIGMIFFEQKNWKAASFWLEQALTHGEDEKSGFMNLDSRTFLPAINLCVCYYHLGDTKKAYKYHKLSKKFKPKNENVLENEKFFSELFNL